MMAKQESLPVMIVRHPFVWAGVGMWIRNYDKTTSAANFWKGVGSLALGIGVVHAVARKTTTPVALIEVA